MICINCGCSFHRRPTQTYFCSRMCWEDAAKNTPWRILAEVSAPVLSAIPEDIRSNKERGIKAGAATRTGRRYRRRPIAKVLTPRQIQVAQLLQTGISTKELARALGITPNGAQNHVRRIFGRLGVKNRVHLAVKFVQGYA